MTPTPKTGTSPSMATYSQTERRDSIVECIRTLDALGVTARTANVHAWLERRGMGVVARILSQDRAAMEASGVLAESGRGVWILTEDGEPLP